MIRKNKLDWDQLNELGRQYHAEIQQGHGVAYPQGNDDRSHPQIKIAGQIVTAARPYLQTIARALVYGGGHDINTSNGKKHFLLHHARGRVPLEELVQEASLRIISSLKTYNPERAQIKTFIALHTTTAMYNYTKPENVYSLSDTGDEKEIMAGTGLAAGLNPEEKVLQAEIVKLLATLSPFQEYILRGELSGQSLSKLRKEMIATRPTMPVPSLSGFKREYRKAISTLKEKAMRLDISFL